MESSILTKVFTLASFAGILFFASIPGQVSALSADHLVVRSGVSSRNGHAGIAKRVKTNAKSKRCKVKSASLSSTVSVSSTKSKTASAAHGRATLVTSGGGNPGSGSGGGSGGGSAPAVPSSGKLGLVFGGDDNQLYSFAVHKNMALYNWAVDPPSTWQSAGFNFMPMLWGERNVGSGCEYNGGCFSTVQASDWNTVMFINEANEPAQADMTVSRACELWHQYMQPLANQGVRTVGPVMSSNPNGKTWTTQFYNQCQGCTVHIQPVHYYDVTAQGMINYINDYHELSGGKPIMVTEWACQNYNGGAQCSESEIYAFNTQVIEFMESTSWVIGYMPFGVMMGPLPDGVNQLNILMDGNGKPTALAQLMGY